MTTKLKNSWIIIVDLFESHLPVLDFSCSKQNSV